MSNRTTIGNLVMKKANWRESDIDNCVGEPDSKEMNVTAGEEVIMQIDLLVCTMHCSSRYLLWERDFFCIC